MIVYLAKTGKIRALDFDSRAPRAFRADAYADPKVAHHGYLSVGVPGVVAGLAAALKR
jgi:gamma-glutamyltranspeptidase